MQIKVLLFATLKEIARESQITLILPTDTATVREVREALTQRFPNIEAHVNAAIAALNEEYAFNEEILRDGDSIAFFPPVSGGAPDDEAASPWPEIYLLPDAPIDHDEIVASITTAETGAVCFFSGMVRGKTQRDGHLPETQFLEYEAYTPMALAKMRQVAAEIRARWPLVQGIAIAQRVGKIGVGQNTVLIACSSAHRDDGCFEAARYGIDRLKEIVPVWKKEISPAGAAWIEGHYTPTPADRTE
ncbi:MAG: molybdenum cofactor biosynthesis protein MoaE [Anaerolineae bacterium]